MDIYFLICRHGHQSKFGQISFGCPDFRFSGTFSTSPCFRSQVHAWPGKRLTRDEIFFGREKSQLLIWVLLDLLRSRNRRSWLVMRFVFMFHHHDEVAVDAGRVYWFLASVVFSCAPFLLFVVFSKVFFSILVFVGSLCRSWSDEPHLSLNILHFTIISSSVTLSSS